MIEKSIRLQGVHYEIRGPVFEHAQKLENSGLEITKLNIGNPGPFGYEVAPHIIKAMADNMGNAAGYTDSRGLPEAREAILHNARSKGIPVASISDIFLGNGVSELILMVMQGLLNEGDEVLVPTPDYPLWTASINLNRGKAVHYFCDEKSGWFPNVADIENRISRRTRAIVLINPNNPTGAVYPPEILKQIVSVAERHNLIIFSDEIYSNILYDGAKHYPTANFTGDVLCFTFGGLSKNYVMAGFRTGWMIITGKTGKAKGFLEGLVVLSSMRLCANVLPEYGVKAALEGPDPMTELTAPGGRIYEQRKTCIDFINQTEGLSAVSPSGAFYIFPKLDLKYFGIYNDLNFTMDLLSAEQVLVVQGLGFNWPHGDHFRIVFLPEVTILQAATEKIARFLLKVRAGKSNLNPNTSYSKG